MTFPPAIVELPADHTCDRHGPPLVIVAHDTEGVDSRATLQHGDGRGVSVHCLIQKFPRKNGTTDLLDGRPDRLASGALIYRMVPDDRGANHAGFSTWEHNGVVYSPAPGHTNVNAVSLGFELECMGASNPGDRYTDEQLLCAGYLIATWRAQHGPLPLVRHADIDPARRSDTFNLSVAQLEDWTRKAMVLMAPPLAPVGRYRVRGTPVYQRQDGTGPIAGYLAAGETVIVDTTYPGGTGHLAIGLGFVWLRDMEAL